MKVMFGSVVRKCHLLICGDMLTVGFYDDEGGHHSRLISRSQVIHW
jgi:hypothetical protein